MAASWASKESSCKGSGCTDCGASEARGGMEVRIARGAEVGGIK